MKEPITKQFCMYCGHKMIGTKLHDGFHPDNGLEQWHWFWTCPKRGYVFSRHSQFQTDLYGSSYAYEI